MTSDCICDGFKIGAGCGRHKRSCPCSVQYDPAFVSVFDPNKSVRDFRSYVMMTTQRPDNTHSPVLADTIERLRLHPAVVTGSLARASMWCENFNYSIYRSAYKDMQSRIADCFGMLRRMIISLFLKTVRKNRKVTNDQILSFIDGLTLEWMCDAFHHCDWSMGVSEVVIRAMRKEDSVHGKIWCETSN